MHVMFNTKSIRKIWLCWCVNMRRKSKKWKKWQKIGKSVFNAFLGKCPHFALEILGLCSLSVCNLSGFTTTCFSIPCDKAAISFGSLLALPWLDPACIAFLFRQRVSRWFECRPWGPCPPYPPSPQAQSPLPKGKVRRCSTPHGPSSSVPADSWRRNQALPALFSTCLVAAMENYELGSNWPFLC